MSVAMKTEVVIPAPELRGAILHLFDDPELEIGCDGPAGCIAGETRIYNPVTGKHVPVKELYERKEAPIVQTLMGAVQAEVPFRKGVADLYRLTLASGRKCIVTQNHLFLGDNSWMYLSACAPGTRLLISWPCPDPTTEAPGSLVSWRDALRLSQKPLSSQERYSAYSRRCDELLQMARDTVRVPFPQQGGVRGRTHADLCEDDQASLSVHTRRDRQSARRARTCYVPSSDDTVYTQFHDRPGTSLLTDVSCRYDAQSQRVTRPPLPTVQCRLDAGSTRRRELSLMARLLSLLSQRLFGAAIPTHRQSMPYSSFSDMTQKSAGAALSLDAYNLSSETSNTSLHPNKTYHTAQWDTVSSIEYVRTDEYFDLHVPIAEHYLAEGIWHHNTGKTFGILYVIHLLLLKYPGAKWLVARKRNTDLAGSAMATYRDYILDEREGVHYFGGNKVKPPGYIYPNGSFLAVNGLDRPGKVKSMDFDGIYINEATDCTQEDIETCHIRLARRKGSALPPRFQKLLMDFNPDAPTHFLNQRMNAGLCRRLPSRHEDNPFLYDARAGDWTEAGRRYIAELDTLSGARLARYRYGIWASAEGAVYQDSWDAARNVIDRFPIPASWPRYLGLDFGYTNPFVCKWYAMDEDGRLYVYRELYKTQTLVEDHCIEIALRSGWYHLLPREHPRYARRPPEWADPLPREVIADHDAEGRATFERHLGLYTTPAIKDVAEGIQATAARYRRAGDGRPRLLYFRDALIDRDPLLSARKKPTCSLEEIDNYRWRQGASGVKDEPVKEDDHGCDVDRYLSARFALRQQGIAYGPNIWR